MCGASIGHSGMKDRVSIHVYHGSSTNLFYSILQFTVGCSFHQVIC